MSVRKQATRSEPPMYASGYHVTPAFPAIICAPLNKLQPPQDLSQYYYHHAQFRFVLPHNKFSDPQHARLMPPSP